ncbi:tRNA-Thr(GGU) m(6)t(6)A37 methyltransferase TsaA [Mesorhizobium sp. Root157]|uniref:tRNA (N6-threonylcarbamoyladenosine(37)-N6)-methyltransferase TrmO n=1 Tax=Mesorhizobium sp. Root157 TaxID=1736477 RepID=UPI000702086D|nr:tRNA (N6-threonylcarbamoyladenosine(37)-N6)-methyltransferase TrmO [Mesorhizobium sp. Root157]KQZ81451.1 tRNA-Thr(GGU) m(6)t(6)A37 methyltransferase TsaA [Mesorhizobium sp. Root157]
MFEWRDSEKAMAVDPATMAGDAHIVFIGRVLSPWIRREDCPKNMRAAVETGQRASLLVDTPYRDGLLGLEGYSHAHILTWLHYAPRNLIVQKPRHAPEAKGVFALRSPVRPNPVGLHTVKPLAIDISTGKIELEAIDVLDGTPVIDIKPYLPSIDSIADATTPDRNHK